MVAKTDWVTGDAVTATLLNALGTAANSGGATNLTSTRTSTTVTVVSDTGTDAALAAADGTNAGVMTSAMQVKLAGVATSATANSADATLLARANHTGTQAVSTLTTTGTASASTFLRGDGAWAAPAPLVNAMSFSATPAFDLAAYDQFNMTLTAAVTSATFAGGVDGKAYRLRLKDNGTARAIALGSTVRAVGVTIPTTTVISKVLYLVGIWNSADSKLDVVGIAQEA